MKTEQVKPGIWRALEPAKQVKRESEKKVITVSPGIVKWIRES